MASEGKITIPGTETELPIWVVLVAGVVVVAVVVFQKDKPDDATDNPDLAGVPSGLVLSEVSRQLEEQRLNFLSILQNALDMFQGETPPGTIDPGTTGPTFPHEETGTEPGSQLPIPPAGSETLPGGTEPDTGTRTPPIYSDTPKFPDQGPAPVDPERLTPPVISPPPVTEINSGGGVRLTYAPDQIGMWK